jgi:hypothetical protein
VRRRIAIALLLFLGLARMVLDLGGLRAGAAVLGATGAAPAPRVFSMAAGLETYSSRFFVQWSDAAGVVHETRVTPDHTAGLAGPYNRRNVYGAALAYGPVLAADPRSASLLDAIAREALCGRAPLLAELGIETPGRVGPPRVRVEPLHGPESLPLLLEVSCP